MRFRGFFVRSTPDLVLVPAPAEVDLAANEAAFESMPSWMTR